MNKAPVVTIAIPLRDEAPRLPGLLDAVLAQDYPAEDMQILLIDGGSQDETRRLAAAAAARNHHLAVLDNPRRLAASGLNLALAQAVGEVFVRLDARTRPAPDYVTCCIRALTSGGADGFLAGVGGPQLATGETPSARIHALALNHPFGVGSPAYRRASRPQRSETIYLGAYRTAWLHRVRGWDESFAFNEDYEINTRLRQAGAWLLVDPAIRCHYLARESCGQLARQYFHFGAWRTVTIRRHRDAWRWRHLAPALLAAAFLLALLLAVWSLWPLVGLLGVYLGLDLAVSLQIGLRHGFSAVPRLLAVFPLLHLSWGAGFWLGVIRSPRASVRR
ncbi:MAG: glycosyltransferase [Caldilineales bacterium]|nr:glycosyltransferase [Caldilineales bacterium]